ncbi:MAG TPA: HU family DNA-binding protein [Ignavibacteria bacterium]|mgnify:CR=1 FL=1|nr:HU family DNA-binding protein [Ignavibacteria bacterium]HMR41045.1 HU family DNA-binding protein [Ignavibacteria bacterium]
MNKEKIISAVSIDLGLSKEKAEKAVNAVFDTIIKVMQKEDEFSIQKFGSFRRSGGKDNDVKKKIRFIPAKKLALRINSDFRNLKKVKVIKDLNDSEKLYSKYEIDLSQPEYRSADQMSDNSLSSGWVNSKSGSRKILISDDLINLHKEITKEIKKNL